MKTQSPFEIAYIPEWVRVRGTLIAQKDALRAVADVPKNAARVELYWVTYNFSYRQHIERWLGSNG